MKTGWPHQTRDKQNGLKDMNRPEQQLQIACYQLWTIKLARQYAIDPRLLIHVPNGGYRTRAEAGRFKAMGVVAGVPDLLLFAPRGVYNGLALELKAGASKPSTNQVEYLDLLSRSGWRAQLCYSVEDFQLAVSNYLTGR